ncbi:hypothetical protein ACP70R_007653 [Stipagrostis hirtigluma subsp. patula]
MAAPASGGSADDSEDYSPAVTVVRFDPPLPLLRAPVPSPAPGPDGEAPVLAFRDAASWRAAWEAAESSLLSQCEAAGARSGCSITASRKCKPPWWKGLFGAAPTDYEERERCEEREMAACLNAAKEACIKFAKEKCTAPFRDARIASRGLLDNTDFIVWGAGCKKTSSTSLCVTNEQCPFNPGPGSTTYKGSDLLDSLASKENNNSG